MELSAAPPQARARNPRACPGFSTKVAASQSSSSGWLGACPIFLKSFGVATRPRPKCQPQIRFTSTRAVSRWSGRVSRSASSLRPV